MMELKILRKLFSLLVVSLLLGNIFIGLSSIFIYDKSESDITNTFSLSTDRRLMSKDNLARNLSFDSIIPYSTSGIIQTNEISSRFNASKPTKSQYITCKIGSIYDLIIDESTGLYPKAMETNASLMRFLLNFTIEGVEGLTNHEDAFENLTISNETDLFLIVPDWVSDDWTWTNLFSGALPTDNYSLSFSLNVSVLSSLNLGNYNLTLHTYYYHSVMRNSYDYIPLPMKDLRVSFRSITPSKFNNKLETSQLFNISVQVTETVDGETFNYVQSLPKINDSQNQLINPNVTLISNSGDKSGILPIIRFTDLSQETEGRYFFEVNLSSSLAASFIDGLHNLVVSVTTHDGIVANNDSFDNFEAQGTVLLVRIKEINVGSNDLLNWSTLTNNGKEETFFRVNIFETITVSYQVFEENGTDENSRQLIGYQDPNQADNPFAKNTSDSSSWGNGTITLNASTLTPAGGYSLFFFVIGHRTSQENSLPTNVTIYWDLLKYEYSYKDNLDEIGTSSSYNQRALGIDLNSWWFFSLEIYYASDNTPANSTQMSYRFSDQSWLDITDGANGDPLDGIIVINRSSNIAAELVFECRIENGSIIDTQGTYFVNKTVDTSTFDLNVTWTYIIVELEPFDPDRRLGTLTQTGIYLTAFWAHNESIPFNGFLVGEDWLGSQDYEIINGNGIFGGLIQTETGSYLYKITGVVDLLFGITKITNRTGGTNISIEIIWEEIYFTFSNEYNSSINPVFQDFRPDLEYFSNFGENTSLFCYGIHTYDSTPFKGEATLYDSYNIDSFVLDFNTDGVAVWKGDFSEAFVPIDFRIWEITNATNDYNVKNVGEDTLATISWDKIVIYFDSNMFYPHGSIASVDIRFEYLVYKTKEVNLSTVKYNLNTSNAFHLDINWTHFTDFSLRPAVRWYNVSALYDSSTGLSGFETRYNWINEDSGYQNGNLVICWIDDKDPSIKEYYTKDFGNGTIWIIVEVTDNSEDWIGSGIAHVKLFDKRSLVDQEFPLTPFNFSLSSENILRYAFKYNYDQTISGGFFGFDFGEQLNFIITVTDHGTPDFPDWIDNSRNSHTTSTPEFSLIVNRDSDPNNYGILYFPQFLSEIEISYSTLNTSSSTIEGDLLVRVSVQDSVWSGLNNQSARLIITDLGGDIIINTTMESIDIINDLSKRSAVTFTWSGNLPVFHYFFFTVILTDNAGNTNKQTMETEIKDTVPPRIIDIFTSKTADRRLKVTVEIEERGSEIQYIMIQIGNSNVWFNLSREIVGVGGSYMASSPIQNFSAIVPLQFVPENIIFIQNYPIKVRVADESGNELTTDVLDSFDLTPVIVEPYFLFAVAILLIFGVIAGIRITSKTEGYDMKKILSESEKVTREVMIIQMDEYALGVTVNFFDQVQGPVPVIWEPPLLEDQEQVMLDLADKSFSTLEFVGTEEEERSGTFDFSTGSYECTALGYSFAVDNPEARGGKENLTVVLLLRKEWGDNLLFFQDELLEKLREIRNLVLNKENPSNIEKEARQLREFVSRLLIAFNKIYKGIDYENLSMEE